MKLTSVSTHKLVDPKKYMTLLDSTSLNLLINMNPTKQNLDYYNPYISSQMMKEVNEKMKARTDRFEGAGEFSDREDSQAKEPPKYRKLNLLSGSGYVQIDNLVGECKAE